MIGWIKLHRSLTQWEWYDDAKTVKLFMHLLLKANIETKVWRGITVPKGSMITSRRNLSAEANLTEREVRTILKRLDKCGSIQIKTTHEYTLITVKNWEEFQEEKRPTERPTKRPTKKIKSDPVETVANTDKTKEVRQDETKSDPVKNNKATHGTTSRTTTTKEERRKNSVSVSVRETKKIFNDFEISKQDQVLILEYIENGMSIEVIRNGLMVPYNRNVKYFDSEEDTAPIKNPDAYGLKIIHEWYKFGVQNMDDVKRFNKILTLRERNKEYE